MVKIYSPLPLKNDQSIDIEAWTKRLALSETNTQLILEVCQFAALICADRITRYDISCLAKALETAEIIAQLQFDVESIAAAILCTLLKETELTTEYFETQWGRSITQLVKNTQLLNAINQFQYKKHNAQQIDNVRNMILAMIRDMRGIVIKLAERLCVLRHLKKLDVQFQKTIAQETMDIFAPLAHRLGLQQLKWELEDFAFFYLHTTQYNDIATHLASTRIAREKRLKHITTMIEQHLQKNIITGQVYGRVKHIYSIQRKMQEKNLTIFQVHDALAVRIIVDDIKACYTTLSIINNLFTPLVEDFDDYIIVPKPNGYQSIHTSVLDQNDQVFEIQIRTHEMHKNAEQGIAAHWVYKEGKLPQSSYEQKIVWLRRLLEWQKELTHTQALSPELEKNLFEDRVYVFTPKGDVFDLIAGATPLDFAYHIHTQLGHHCRGVKVNGKLVPLTYHLKTGNQVEIMTYKNGLPSRDWLHSQPGHLKTSTARAKVIHWFKQQDFERHASQGQTTFNKELRRLKIKDSQVNINSIATQLNYKSAPLLFAALYTGDLKLSQIINLLPLKEKPSPSWATKIVKLLKSKTIPQKNQKEDITIAGTHGLLSRLAQCCKPIPGDTITGYITQTQGISIHRQDCPNIISLKQIQHHRLIEVSWNTQNKKVYPVDIEIITRNSAQAIQALIPILNNEKINLLDLNTSTKSQQASKIKIILTIEIDHRNLLEKLLHRLQKIAGIEAVKRIHQGGDLYEKETSTLD